MIEKILERLREKFKYNSEQAEIYREGSYKDAYFREKKDLYLDRANTYGEAIRIVQEVAKEYGNVWIPCSERLPNDNERVLVIDEDGIMAVCRFVESVNVFMTCWDGDEFADVIAWQPLPAPYQK